jgi:hypothetical protein
MPNPRHAGSHTTHAGNIGAHLAMITAKHKAIAPGTDTFGARALSARRNNLILWTSDVSIPGSKGCRGLLILIGLLLIAVGLLWPWIGWLGLGHLPGDIVVERKNFTLYAPIATGLLISVVLTLLLWLINW